MLHSLIRADLQRAKRKAMWNLVLFSTKRSALVLGVNLSRWFVGLFSERFQFTRTFVLQVGPVGLSFCWVTGPKVKPAKATGTEFREARRRKRSNRNEK